MEEMKGLTVITGASQGIGKALAKKFVGDGNPCLLISRNISPMPEFKGKEVLYEKVDVSDYSAMQSAIDKAKKQYGPVTCIVNNAGMINVGDFLEIPLEKMRAEVDALIMGVINGIKAVLPGMVEKKSGSIINISSVADHRPSPVAISYHASKHAVRSISESLQMAEAKNNIRVMNIAPGLVKTNIHKNMGISFEKYCEMVGNPTFIQPEELADIIYFCWKLPQHICIRNLVVMPTDSDY